MKHIFFLILLITVLVPLIVFAATEPTVVKLENPLKGDQTDLRVILGEITEKVLAVMGSLALLVFVYGGFLWLTAAGSDEKVKKGSQAMLWAVIGIFIVFSSYAILSLVLKGLGARGLGGIEKERGGLCLPKGSELCIGITDSQICKKNSKDKCNWFGDRCLKDDQTSIQNCGAKTEEAKCAEAGCIWLLPKE